MIGIHQSVARSVRMAAVRRAVLVVGGFLLLAGVGITAGMAHAKDDSAERTVTPTVKTETPSDIPTPTYKGPAATSTKEAAETDATVESAATPPPPAKTPTNNGNVIRTETPPPPVTNPDPESTPDPDPVVPDPEPTDPNP